MSQIVLVYNPDDFGGTFSEQEATLSAEEPKQLELNIDDLVGNAEAGPEDEDELALIDIDYEDAGVPTGPNVLGFVTDSAVLQSVQGHAFFAGSDLVSTSNNVRATLENPSLSGKVLLVQRLIVAHDQSGILTVNFIRRPDTNRPTTEFPAMNLDVQQGAGDAAGLMKVDSGSALSGGDGGSFIPSMGNVLNDLQLSTPVIIHPGDWVGLNMDVGETLSSGEVMVLAAWVERDEQDINELPAAHEE